MQYELCSLCFTLKVFCYVSSIIKCSANKTIFFVFIFIILSISWRQKKPNTILLYIVKGALKMLMRQRPLQ